MVSVDAEEGDRQRTDEFFLMLLPPAAIEVDSSVSENNHDIRGLGVHLSAEIGNALEISMSVTG